MELMPDLAVAVRGSRIEGLESRWAFQDRWRQQVPSRSQALVWTFALWIRTMAASTRRPWPAQVRSGLGGTRGTRLAAVTLGLMSLQLGTSCLSG
jgi:hypothetical protein